MMPMIIVAHSFSHSQSGCHLCQDTVGLLKGVELERRGAEGERRRDVILRLQEAYCWCTLSNSS